MNFSKHASLRKKQRGVRDEIIPIIEVLGDIKFAKGNAYKVFFPKKNKKGLISALKQLIALLEKNKASTLVVSGDNEIITVY